MQMTPGETPVGGDLRTLTATRTKQTVRCALVGRVTRAITCMRAGQLLRCILVLFSFLFSFSRCSYSKGKGLHVALCVAFYAAADHEPVVCGVRVADRGGGEPAGAVLRAAAHVDRVQVRGEQEHPANLVPDDRRRVHPGRHAGPVAQLHLVRGSHQLARVAGHPQARHRRARHHRRRIRALPLLLRRLDLRLRAHSASASRVSLPQASLVRVLCEIS